MVELILNAVFGLLQTLVSLLMAPIDAALSAAFPGLQDTLQDVVDTAAQMADQWQDMIYWIPVHQSTLDVVLLLVTGGIILQATNAIPGIFKLMQLLKFW